jgi:hypothetical protein
MVPIFVSQSKEESHLSFGREFFQNGLPGWENLQIQ